MKPPRGRPGDARWMQLQTELCDLAFVLDQQGRHEAADLACTIAARIGELRDAGVEEDQVVPAGLRMTSQGSGDDGGVMPAVFER